MAGIPAMAESTPGVTVTADENSPTGYTATFVYENADASEVKLIGTFSFYEEGGEIGVIPEKYYGPYDWKPGLFRASVGDAAAWQGTMEKEEGTDYWTISIPLPGGHYQYFYNVDGAEENIEDPVNPPICSNEVNGNKTGTSTFDVPYDESQGGPVDWSFIVPREDTAKGEYSFVSYEDAYGDERYLGIYLPAGYDADAETPYKVLYVSHGGGGNETEPFNQGNVDVIFDNMIADGELEPTVLVTMNNSVYRWDAEQVNGNIMNAILPFVEENYNVCTEPSGRAFAGISMGGVATSHLYFEHADQFGYFGILCGADASVDLNTLDVDKLKLPKMFIGGGMYDAGMFGVGYINESYQTEKDRTVKGLIDRFDEVGIPYTTYLAYGGHDYASAWPQLMRKMILDVLWK